jgi:hypothetical protein
MILEMTTSAIICAGALALPSRGTSETARYVSSQMDKGLNYLQDSIIFGMKPCFDELHLVFEECQNRNWDGYQAEPVTDETYHMALQFLKALPLGSPSPSIGAEPDGHLTLEWYRSPRRTISLSVSPEGVLHYAALLGGNKAYGSETFFGEVPETIMTLVKRVLAA